MSLPSHCCCDGIGDEHSCCLVPELLCRGVGLPTPKLLEAWENELSLLSLRSWPSEESGEKVVSVVEGSVGVW